MISCKQKCSVTLRMHQIRFSLGLCPEPHWGRSQCFPYTLVGCGRGHPLPFLYPVDSTPVASHLELRGNLLQGLRGIDDPEYHMQLNLHGSPSIFGLFLYCFGYRKKTKFSTKNPWKYAILTLKSQKNFTPTPWHLDSNRVKGSSHTDNCYHRKKIAYCKKQKQNHLQIWYTLHRAFQFNLNLLSANNDMRAYLQCCYPRRAMSSQGLHCWY